MPFKETTKMEERLKLVKKWKSGKFSVTELSEEFGVSRPTVYHWTKLYEKYDEAGLLDRRPIPKSCPHRTSPVIEQRIVEAKNEFPYWGPKKILDLLRAQEPELAWPSATTGDRILREKGLVEKRRRYRRDAVSPYVKKLDPSESGEMMTADHKGQIRTRDGIYTYPLTIADPVSRYVYAIDGKTSTSVVEAKETFVRVFREYGIPWFIATDNGNPFASSRSLGALSALSIWWIELGITPVKIHKGCPWENGIHERMHLTLKRETARPPAENSRLQQQRFDAFETRFNNVRPHDALAGKTPATFLKPCRRPYPRRLPPLDYPGHFETRAVRSKGEIKWNGETIFVGQAFVGKRIGLVEIDDATWAVYFSKFEIGRLDERKRKIY